MVRLINVKILLSIIINEDFHADKLDVKNVFLHDTFLKEILGMGKSSWRFFNKIKVFFLEY